MVTQLVAASLHPCLAPTVLLHHAAMAVVEAATAAVAAVVLQKDATFTIIQTLAAWIGSRLSLALQFRPLEP